VNFVKEDKKPSEHRLLDDKMEEEEEEEHAYVELLDFPLSLYIYRLHPQRLSHSLFL
jgi:hypothetical protein